MPHAAIKTGCVDVILALRAIAPALVSLVMIAGAAQLFGIPLPRTPLAAGRAPRS
jgi:hypothetical protein